MTKDMYIELCYDGVNRPLCQGLPTTKTAQLNPEVTDTIAKPLTPKESSDAPMQRNCP